ncbi:MAG: diguanylate cyclase (GGDEF)-like protein/PAS domain S-box-containing protein [Gammaproteobacteria bacterium]|jgi:diguanylate cyclase (GGDEF)-like protein/PAS domain S-box-containing protein
MTVEECLAFSDSSENDLQSIHPDDRDAYSEYMDTLVSKDESVEIECRLLTAKGNIRVIHEIVRSVISETGKIIGYIGTSQEMTERVNLENKLRETEIQFQHTFNDAPIGMALISKNGTIIEVNQAAARMIGYSQHDAIGASFIDMTHPDELLGSIQRLQELSEGKKDYYNVIRQFRQIDGNYIWVDLHCSLLRDFQGDPAYIIAQGIDITEQRSLAEKLNYQASHDSLTNLINRRELDLRMNRLIESAHSHDSIHSFCYMDLDQFKIINDTFGHAAGDELLRQLCALIQSSIRARDTLARLGGDEFGLLMEHCAIQDALLTAENLRSSINDFQFVWDESLLGVGVSMGIVIIDNDSGTCDDILKAADNACYMAKDKGRNRIEIYTETNANSSVRHSEMQ